MIRVSVRFNMFGVRVIKQGIVPCKLLIAASEIVVFVGCNITDVTPIFCQAHSVVHRVVNSIGRVLESADKFHFRTSHSAYDPFFIENLPICYSSAFLELQYVLL